MSDLRKRIAQERESLDQMELPTGHHERFQKRLKSRERRSPFQVWKVAAGLILVLASSVIYWSNKPTLTKESSLPETAENSSEEVDHTIPLEDATFYYNQSINHQFAALDEFYGDDDSKQLIDETKMLITELQKEYEELEKQLAKSADERIVIAMISNYQRRIELLEDLVNKLKYIKQLKTEQNEKSNHNA